MWAVGSLIHELALGGPPVDMFNGDFTKPAGSVREVTYPRMVSCINIPPHKRFDERASDPDKPLITSATEVCIGQY